MRQQQPTLFDKKNAQGNVNDERLVLYALGNFQARGKVLAERDLPLDRLRGALRRAAETFGVDELEDEAAVHTLSALGARVRRVHAFSAKHPFHIIVPKEMAERALRAYQEMRAD